MPGTFTVACAQTTNGSANSREVSITVSSVNGYSGTVSMAYSAVPDTGTVTLSDDMELLSVPKNGYVEHLVTVTFSGGASECDFTATGTEGALNDSVTIKVKPLYGKGEKPPAAQESKGDAKPTKPKGSKK